MTLLVEKGFRVEDFANLHPGGKLGKRLMRVEQLMHAGDDAPTVEDATPMRDVIYEMSRKGLGMTCVTAGGRLAGIITDGDLRRRMGASTDVLALTARDVMTTQPATITRDVLAVDALNLMEQRKITSVIVTDVGILKPHAESGEFALSVLYPGMSADEARAAIGWPLSVASEPETCAAPTAPELEALRALEARTAAAHREPVRLPL